MINIKGLTIETDSKGHRTKAIFDFKLHGELLEDIIDRLIIREAKADGDFVDYEEGMKKIRLKRKLAKQ